MREEKPPYDLAALKANVARINATIDKLHTEMERLTTLHIDKETLLQSTQDPGEQAALRDFLTRIASSTQAFQSEVDKLIEQRTELSFYIKQHERYNARCA